MARKKDLIDVGEIEVTPKEQPKSSSKQKASPSRGRNPRSQQRVSTKGGRKVVVEKQSFGKRIAAYFKGLKAELKLVTWPPFKSTQKVKGVWANTGVVLMVVLFFLIIMTAFDVGLSALLKLLVGKVGK